MSLLTRACDGKKCCICSDNIDVNQNGILCTVPTRHLRKLKSATIAQFQIKWDLTKKSNCFHEECWENVNKNRKTSSVERNTIEKIIETVERYKCIEEVQECVSQTVQLLLKAKHVVSFTGAGISVSAGLNTYRGADGIDTIAALGESEITNPDDLGEEIDYAGLQPTFTHTALVRMYELGKMDYCATQNCDNLHQKAGFPRTHISDLHGNIFVEYCDKCKFEYVREDPVDIDSTDAKDMPWYVECSRCKWGHFTGRRCTQKGCRGKLRDTIVNFSDLLHDTVCGGFQKAEAASSIADICFCLGSSLTVFPANELPTRAKHTVIVNLQETDLDNAASVRVYATSDMFFALLIPALESALSDNVVIVDDVVDEPVKKRRRLLKKQEEIIDLVDV